MIDAAQPVVAESGHEEALLQFLYQAPIGLVQASPEGDVTLMNPMAAQLLLRLAPGGDLGNVFDALAPVMPDLRSRVAAAGARSGMLIDGLRLELTAAQSASDEASVLSLQVLRLDSHTLLASLSDATQQVRLEQDRLTRSVRDAVRTDPLTGLPTRDVLREHLAEALALRRHTAAATHVAVVSINIDRFHRFNLLHGPSEGDLLLRQVAERLMGIVRTGDGGHTLVARLGADEFAIVLGRLADPSHAGHIAQRIVAQLGRPYLQGTRPVHATVSVGLALAEPMRAASPQAESTDTLLQAASLAMREAKRTGGGRWRPFETALQALALHRSTLESDLRLALDRHELFVVYQPIVRLGRGGMPSRIDGVEALVRWRHPQRGIVSPLEFIQLAEQTGLIVPLGEQVLAEACTQMTHWIETLGPRAPATMSVNLSVAQLRGETDIVPVVQAQLDRSGLAPERLQLEITESMAAQDAQIQRRLVDLKSVGVRLALDDFGTGYSSLSSLQHLPVDVVKIDRSFVSELQSSEHHRALVRATVLVADSLKLQTVAEGVEDAAQVQALESLGCDKAQGFWFSRPLGAIDTTQWLKAWAEAASPRPVRQRVA